MSNVLYMPLNHLEVISNLKADSMPPIPRLQAAATQLVDDLERLSSIQRVDVGRDSQGAFSPLSWCSLADQMRFVRRLALNGRFHVYAERVRAMSWQIRPSAPPLGLRLKAFYMDLSLSINPYASHVECLEPMVIQLQNSEDAYHRDPEELDKHELVQPSSSNAFSTLSNHDQMQRVLYQALRAGLWDAVLEIDRSKQF